MRDIVIDLNNLSTTLYEDTIIREGEHNASQLVITLTPELLGFQNNIVFRLNNEAPLIASNVPNVLGVITYPIPNTVTFEYGQLRVEIQSYNTTTMLTKSLVLPFKVTKGIGGVPVTIPPTLYGLEGSVEPIPNTFVVRDVNGGGKFDNIQYDLTPLVPMTSLPQGQLQWDTRFNVPSIGILGTTVGASLQIGQDVILWARNVSGSTMPIGTVVAIVGSTGNIPSITFADADGTSQQNIVLGVVGGYPIPNNTEGYVVISGLVSGVNTNAWNEGDILYLSNTLGGMTNIQPVSPSTPVVIGYVLKKSGSGIIYCRVARVPIAQGLLIRDVENNYVSGNVEGALLEIANKLKAHGITMP